MAIASRAEGAGEADRVASDAPAPLPLAAEIRRRLGPPPRRSDWPLVSIIVLNRDGAGHLRSLLAGLVEHTDYPRLELILIDNASGDDSLDFIRTVETPFPISIVANARNESFSDGCNQGAELAVGDLLLFLNNDAEPFESAWLRELVACVEQPDVGAVGPTLIEPCDDERVPAGYVVQQRGLLAHEADGLLDPTFRENGADPLGGGLGGDLECVAVAAACVLVDRGTFEAVGGFSRGYMYGPEDVDLMLKIRAGGKRVLSSGRSLLIHSPASTLKTLPPAEFASWLRANRRLFWERWGPRIRREYDLDLIDGHGVWAEPDAVPPSSPTRAEVEALGYCIKTADPGGWEGAAASVPSLAALHDGLRRRGHRCIVLEGDESEDLIGFNYDVAIHLRGPARYMPKSGQLNVLWVISHFEMLTAIECSRYDLILCMSEGRAERLRGEHLDLPVVSFPIETPSRCASKLSDAVELRAREIGFRTRIAPG